MIESIEVSTFTFSEGGKFVSRLSPKTIKILFFLSPEDETLKAASTPHVFDKALEKRK